MTMEKNQLLKYAHIRFEMGNLLERRVRLPHSLDTHLRQIHSTKGVQPGIRRHHVYASRQQIENFLQHEALISSKIWRQLESRKVGLKKEERFEVRSFEIDLIQFDWNAVIDATKESIFVSSNGNGLEFSR